MVLNNNFENDFTSEDVGKVFWRVGYNGVLTQLQIHEVKENGDAVLRIGGLSDMSNYDYKIREEVEYMGSSTYGVDTIQKSSDEYFEDLEQAKTASYERYLREVNPFGQYKVARYFDDVFETYVKDPKTREDLVFNKKDAKAEAIKQNDAKPRAYVYYDIRAVK